MSQQLPHVTRSYVGHGKLVEIQERVRELGCTLVIVDDELKPSQQRNMEEALQADEANPVKVIDRTALIIDIFGQRARTQEGRLQVELAQSQYLLPRLVGQWSHLERLGAGIGTRGPGESQLETDRRLIRQRIQKLQQELEQVRKRRGLYRGQRKKSGVPQATLVGYTNVGKSTLFNALSSAGVTAENQLFSTLDPITRRIRLPSGAPLLLTDTVGFIQKLSPTVVAAFRATLEELADSDLLLHVIDITHSKASEQAQVVETTLQDLDLGEKPRLLVVNKMDLLALPSDGREQAEAGARLVSSNLPELQEHPSVFVSAAKGWNLDGLLREMESQLMKLEGPLMVSSRLNPRVVRGSGRG